MALIFHESSNIFHDTFDGITVSRQTSTTVGTTLTPHWHERMEVWLIHSGKMTVSCEQDIFDVYAGDILVINPGQVHSCRVTETPVAIDCLIFDIHRLLTHQTGEVDSVLRNICNGSLRFQHIIRKNEHLQTVIHSIATCPQGDDWSPMEVKGLLLQLLASLCRRYVSDHHYTVPRHLQEVSSLLEYIHLHATDDLNLEQLAAKACMSPSYFCRWFKSAVGESPMAYVTTLRINKAYELLASGCSVTEACRQVGIDDLNNFNRQFRKRVGVAPSKVKAESKRN